MLNKLLALAVLCALTASCERIERTRQCQALAQLVNPEFDAIEKVVRTGKRDPQTIEDIAKKYRWLAEQMKKIAASESLISASVTQYIELLTETATLAHSLADAIRANDTVRSTREQQELERLTRQQRILVIQLGGACRSSS